MCLNVFLFIFSNMLMFFSADLRLLFFNLGLTGLAWVGFVWVCLSLFGFLRFYVVLYVCVCEVL